MSKFIQIHTLTSYAGVLLNRDDEGSAKRMPLGGFSRLRISSQCLKRHWRDACGEWALNNIEGLADSVRSRKLIAESIMPAITPEDVSAHMIYAVRNAFNKAIYGTKTDDSEPRQVLLFGMPEIEYFKNIGRELFSVMMNDEDFIKQLSQVCDAEKAALDEEKKTEKTKDNPTLFNDDESSAVEKPEKSGAKRAAFDKKLKAYVDLAESKLNELAGGAKSGGKVKSTILSAMVDTMKSNAGLVSVLFGRMMTGDVRANMDSSVQVAHAFTVHAEEAETDYFTVIDDLEENSGSGGIFDTELTSGLYYSYVVIDVDGLIYNLGGDQNPNSRTIASEIIEHFIHLVATVSPGAKKGSTAPFGYADFMLIEKGDRQPRSLSSAFVTPVNMKAGDVSQTAAERLISKLENFDKAYGCKEERMVVSAIGLDEKLPSAKAKSGTLEVAARWASQPTSHVS